MTKLATLHRRWSKDPAYQAAYEATAVEYRLVRKLIDARAKSGLSQQELAQRMGTTQSVVARMESGHALPSMRSLVRFAQATQCELEIQFKPVAAH